MCFVIDILFYSSAMCRTQCIVSCTLHLKYDESLSISCRQWCKHTVSIIVSRGGTSEEFVDVAYLAGEPIVEVMAFNVLTSEFRFQGPFVVGQGESFVEGLGGFVNVGGRGRNRTFTELVEGTGSTRKHQDTIALIDNRAFFGNQIHAINDGVD